MSEAASAKSPAGGMLQQDMFAVHGPGRAFEGLHVYPALLYLIRSCPATRHFLSRLGEIAENIIELPSRCPSVFRPRRSRRRASVQNNPSILAAGASA